MLLNGSKKLKAIHRDFACRQCGHNGFYDVTSVAKLDDPVACDKCGAEVDKGLMAYMVTEKDVDAHTCGLKGCGSIVFFRSAKPGVFSCKVCREHITVQDQENG